MDECGVFRFILITGLTYAIIMKCPESFFSSDNSCLIYSYKEQFVKTFVLLQV